MQFASSGLVRLGDGAVLHTPTERDMYVAYDVCTALITVSLSLRYQRCRRHCGTPIRQLHGAATQRDAVHCVP